MVVTFAALSLSIWVTGGPPTDWLGPPLPEAAIDRVALVVVLPEDLAARRLCERSLIELVRDGSQGVVVVCAESSERLPKRILVSSEEAEARAELDRHLGTGCGGRAALLDREGRVVVAGSFDEGMFEHFRLLADHGIGPLRRDSSVPARWESSAPAMSARVEPGSEDSLAHLPVTAEEIERAVRNRGEEIEPVFDRVFTLLAGRPIARLRVSRDYVRQWPDLARHRELRRELKSRQRAHPRSPLVQLTVTEIALLGRDERLAQRAGYAFLACSKGLRGRADDLIQLLSEAPGADRLDRLMEHAIAVGLLVNARDPGLLRRQFDFHLQVREDFDAARRSGRLLVDALGSDARGLNAFAWALLTESRYAGRFPALALEAAVAMERDPAWRTSWRLDTRALAAFENGLVEEAVSLQREALEKCGNGSKPHYRQRLQRYEDAR